MNGVPSDPIKPATINRKPIVTCAGELEVFKLLEDAIVRALPLDKSELRRSLGRISRDVHVSATFTPYSAKVLPRNNQWDLIRLPVFHIYWTECSDIDLYKGTVKEDIEEWLKELNAHDISDWLIVVIENYDGKRANKLLPRTTVLDKIRSDFGPKHGDRCISVINPGKSDNKNADSWRGLISRIRQLLLMGYSKALLKFEDHIRQERERRNECGWHFLDYLKLQEELAQIFEMLGLYDEALVQYDELDALFSQFVVNEQVGEATSWLKEFKQPLQKWHGLRLGPATLSDDISLLELRSFLFAKQAHMLLLLGKIWEVASRCLPFLHSCLRELAILEIGSPPGAITCWLFLACMEVLNACDKYNQAEQIEAYSTNTANLWAYSSQKLLNLGKLCGLMPNETPTSDQLHTVVYLSAGMGDNPGQPSKPSPTDKLKQALCSQTVFNKTYLELAELAMGTYKHIGRIRSARLIGKELASFYMLLGELQKSAAFLGDALRTFEQDNWKELAAHTRIELAECHRKSQDTRKYIRACAAIAAAVEVDELLRWGYFDEMTKNLASLNRTLLVPFKDIIRVNYVRINSENPIMQDRELLVEISLDSNFPREILCDKVMLSVETEQNAAGSKEHRRSSNSILTSKDMQQVDASLRKLRIQRHLDYQQDKQLSSSSVVCRGSPLRRADSNVTPIYHSEFAQFLMLENVKLSPGANVIRLEQMMREAGKFYLGQIAVHVKYMELISVSLQPNLVVEVKREEPSVRFDIEEGPLLSGIEQTMKLTTTVGSYKIEKDSSIKLTASLGLSIKHKDVFCNSLQVPLDHCEPFSSSCIPIQVLADVPSKEHQIVISSPWHSKPISVTLNFNSPLGTTWRLYTVKNRKFVQIVITNQCLCSVEIVDATLSFNESVKTVSLNCNSSQEIVNGLKATFVYEILYNWLEKEKSPVVSLKGSFNLKYKIEEDTRNYTHNFEVADFQTLFYVDAQVEPTKGSEFCRVGTVCHLQLNVRTCSSNANNSLMYEVLAEQSLWAVCGRSAGVLSFDAENENQSVVLDVMPLSSGYLPLPLVRLSKYIPADFGIDNSGKTEQHPRLEPFVPGQVYNSSKGHQVYVINSTVEA